MFALDASLDSYRADIKQIEIDKFSDTVLIGMLHAIMIFILLIPFEASLLYTLCNTIVLPFARWLIFDLMLNAIRGLPLTYQGDGIKDSKSDSFLKLFPLNPILIKSVILAIVIAIALFLSDLHILQAVNKPITT